MLVLVCSLVEIILQIVELTTILFQMPVKHKIDYSFGVNNLLNNKYIDHLSRLKTYEIPNPGRNIYIKLSLKL